MIIPTGHRVLVKPDPIMTEHEVKGTDIRIAIATDEKLEKSNQIFGTVVLIGPQAWRAFREIHDGKERNGEPWAKIGDRVVYSRFAGRQIQEPNSEEEPYVLLNDDDILAVVVEEKV